MTGSFFSAANCRMRRKIRCDCAGEPPGELTISATARALRVANARSSERAMPEIISPGRSGVLTPMTPDSRTTGTTGMSARKRAGNERAQKLERALEDVGHRLGRGGRHAGQLGILGTQVKACRLNDCGWHQFLGAHAVDFLQSDLEMPKIALIFNVGMVFAVR